MPLGHIVLNINRGDNMQIKDVMEETQLSKKAIRYYENCGLIETSRKANGYKDYSDESVHKLASPCSFSVSSLKRII